jgi:hypothetical protein
MKGTRLTCDDNELRTPQGLPSDFFATLKSAETVLSMTGATTKQT